MVRIGLVQKQAMEGAIMNQSLNHSRLDQLLAHHAYEWTLVESFRGNRSHELNECDDHDDESTYIDVSQRIFTKYIDWLTGCPSASHVDVTSSMESTTSS